MSIKNCYVLKNDGYENTGLNITECGINKLLEKLIDDIYSLLIYSDFLFIDLPPYLLNSVSEFILYCITQL